MPPPTSGGTVTIEMLNILEGFDLAGMGHLSADHMHVLAEAQKIAWADREKYLGDPDYATADVLEIQQRLTTKRYAAERRNEIDVEEPIYAQEYAAANSGGEGASDATEEQASHTTHVSVVDEEGNAVSVTCSIEQPFGSAVVAPGTGFLLNNELTDFSDPGSGSANEPEAGKYRRPRFRIEPEPREWRGTRRIRRDRRAA